MQYTSEQKKVIDSVLSIFETGALPSPGSYSTCTVLADGAGISYGKHQCTDKAGSLDKVCQKYVSLNGNRSAELSKYLGYLAANETAKVNPKGPYPIWMQDLIKLLKELGSDPFMQDAQDSVFDSEYFMPAIIHADAAGLTKALSLLVIYDTCIHSGPSRVTTHRKAFPEASPANGGSEEAWVKAYILARRKWLLNSANKLVQKTVYRQDALMEIVNSGNWDLKTPLVVRNVRIS